MMRHLPGQESLFSDSGGKWSVTLATGRPAPSQTTECLRHIGYGRSKNLDLPEDPEAPAAGDR